MRWGNYTDTYWKPAVAAVLGASSVPALREMPLRWLRKAAITWRLRAGMDPVAVAELAGHELGVLWTHYAGVVADHQDRHHWRGVQDAWDWAVTETAVP